jgi:hypothetical protein
MNRRKIGTRLSATAAAMLLVGCTTNGTDTATTGTDTDFPQRANAVLARLAREGASPPTDLYLRSLQHGDTGSRTGHVVKGILYRRFR